MTDLVPSDEIEEFSLALDRGIEHVLPWSRWRHVQDQPVKVEVLRGYLVPARTAAAEDPA